MQDAALELAVPQPSRFYEAAGLLCLCSWKQGGKKERNPAFLWPWGAGKAPRQLKVGEFRPATRTSLFLRTLWMNSQGNSKGSGQGLPSVSGCDSSVPIPAAGTRSSPTHTGQPGRSEAAEAAPSCPHCLPPSSETCSRWLCAPGNSETPFLTQALLFVLPGWAGVQWQPPPPPPRPAESAAAP